MDAHVKKCPLKKQMESLESKSYYSKGINREVGGLIEGGNVSSEVKRKVIYEMNVGEFNELVRKIKDAYISLRVDLKESFLEPDACKKWIDQQVNRKVPYELKHVMQQVSIIGNMENFGILKKPKESSIIELHDCVSPAVVEFGAGRGYLTHMLADCYEMKKIYLVERRSYKLKADRSLRQLEDMSLERLRIDIEDLDLNEIESLKGCQYLAIGKHLCGAATDLAINCCLSNNRTLGKNKLSSTNCHLQGLAIATCCHHLCQWDLYSNKSFMEKMGITKEDFNAMTWFSSWAVDGNSSSNCTNAVADHKGHSDLRETTHLDSTKELEKVIKDMQPGERASFGFICKEIIDIGRMSWLRDQGLDAQMVKYTSSDISPENHLLIAKV